MSTIRITKRAVQGAVRDLVQERPRKRNPVIQDDTDAEGTCLHFHHGKPSCLVGHALHRLGVTESDLFNVYGDVCQSVDTLKNALGIEVAAAALAYLRQVQNEADGGQQPGAHWGELKTV